MKQPTDVQLRMLRIIHAHQRTYGVSPMYHELADILGVTKKAAYDQVMALQHKGYVRQRFGQVGALQVLIAPPPPASCLECPFIEVSLSPACKHPEYARLTWMRVITCQGVPAWCPIRKTGPYTVNLPVTVSPDCTWSLDHGH